MLFVRCGGGLLRRVPSSAFSTVFKLLCFVRSDISGRAAMLEAVYCEEMIDC